MKLMKAATLYGLHDLRIEDVATPTFGENELLIKVTYNGLCGTDASEFAKGQIMVPLNAAHPNSKHFGPTILGHEFVGEVIDAGPNVKERIGERIACGAGVACGKCARCQEGRTNLCDSYYTLGLSYHGGMAEYVTAPASICVPIPNDISYEDAALAQPLAVGIHAVRRSGTKKGDRVILLGVGAIGSFVCVALQTLGVEITAMDIDSGRLETAKKLGATNTILIDREITPEAIRELYSGQADVVFETSGAPGATARALTLTKMGGTLMLLGLNKTPQEVKLFDAVLREVTLQTTVAHVCGDDIPEALQLLKSGVVAKLLTEKIVSLDDSAMALEEIAAGKATGKILVTPLHV